MECGDIKFYKLLRARSMLAKVSAKLNVAVSMASADDDESLADVIDRLDEQETDLLEEIAHIEEAILLDPDINPDCYELIEDEGYREIRLDALTKLSYLMSDDELRAALSISFDPWWSDAYSMLVGSV